MSRRTSSDRIDPKILKEFSRLAHSFSESNRARLERDLFSGLKLFHWLRANPVKISAYSGWTEPIYRLTYGALDPLSVAGSLADGGRFNVGGAQQLPGNLMPGLTKAACLYGASTSNCAKTEASDPIGNCRIFRLTPKKALKLWDLKMILSSMSYPNLTDRINATPMAQRWGLQKSPLESQILAHHLRHLGGDGILYQSQKDPTASVLAFFMKDDNEAHQSFDVSEESASHISSKI